MNFALVLSGRAITLLMCSVEKRDNNVFMNTPVTFDTIIILYFSEKVKYFFNFFSKKLIFFGAKITRKRSLFPIINHMRLWHYKLIPVLPRQQLLGQHRECCAIRGLSWGKKHSIINYVFTHPWEYIIYYHSLIITQMKRRGYRPDPQWSSFFYRGKRAKPFDPRWIVRTSRDENYPEHDARYLKHCISLLKQKIQAAPEGRYDQNEVYRLYSF